MNISRHITPVTVAFGSLAAAWGGTFAVVFSPVSNNWKFAATAVLCVTTVSALAIVPVHAFGAFMRGPFADEKEGKKKIIPDDYVNPRMDELLLPPQPAERGLLRGQDYLAPDVYAPESLWAVQDPPPQPDPPAARKKGTPQLTLIINPEIPLRLQR